MLCWQIYSLLMPISVRNASKVIQARFWKWQIQLWFLLVPSQAMEHKWQQDMEQSSMSVQCIFTVLFQFTKSEVGYISCQQIKRNLYFRPLLCEFQRCLICFKSPITVIYNDGIIKRNLRWYLTMKYFMLIEQ